MFKRNRSVRVEGKTVDDFISALEFQGVSDEDYIAIASDEAGLTLTIPFGQFKTECGRIW